MKHIKPFLLASLLLAGCSQKPTMEPAMTSIADKAISGRGLVTKIDSPASKLKIDHEEIPNLMKEMEMEFEVAPTVKIDEGLVGQLISFELTKKNDTYRVIKISSAAEVSPKDKYLENCARCHGELGEGRLKGIPFTKGHALAHSEKEFIETVTNGKKKMPSFREDFTDDEIKWIVRYVRKVLQQGKTASEKHIH